jgi:predicted component of type VI protein secretion system
VIALLDDLARIAAAALPPLITGTGPSLFGVRSFAEVQSIGPERVPCSTLWARLRAARYAPFATLCLPRRHQSRVAR